MKTFALLTFLVGTLCAVGCSKDDGPTFNKPYDLDVACTDVLGVGPNITVTTPISLDDANIYHLCVVQAGSPYRCTYTTGAFPDSCP